MKRSAHLALGSRAILHPARDAVQLTTGRLRPISIATHGASVVLRVAISRKLLRERLELRALRFGKQNQCGGRRPVTHHEYSSCDAVPGPQFSPFKRTHCTSRLYWPRTEQRGQRLACTPNTNRRYFVCRLHGKHGSSVCTRWRHVLDATASKLLPVAVHARHGILPGIGRNLDPRMCGGQCIGHSVAQAMNMMKACTMKTNTYHADIERRHVEVAPFSLSELAPEQVVMGVPVEDGLLAPDPLAIASLREQCPVCLRGSLRMVLCQGHVIRSHLFCELCTRCFDCVGPDGRSLLTPLAIPIY